MLVCNIDISVGISNVATLVFVRVTVGITVTATTIVIRGAFARVDGRQLGDLDAFLSIPNL